MKQHAVKLSDLRIDGGTQPRTEIDLALVSEYADAMRMNVTFPPIVVFFDGVNNWVADGFHRYHGAKSAGWTQIGAEIHDGTQRDAVLYSVGANAAHGARRTNADKRKAVLTLLNDDEWGQWGNYEIARRCGVSDEMVRGVKASLPKFGSEQKPAEVRYTTKHGTVATMNTENIGRSFRGDATAVLDEPMPETPRRKVSAPSNGLQFARIAIMKLEEIRDDDTERDAAFQLIRRWLDARQA